nr:hypothetical protein [uncultured Senegalimassilia sp.]
MADEQCNHQTKRACVNGTNILPWVERWLSPERLAPYLEASECDAEKALELYRWNVALGQFLIRDISYFEAALRNAYNDTMEARWDGECHWHGATPPFESFARASTGKLRRQLAAGFVTTVGDGRIRFAFSGSKYHLSTVAGYVHARCT